jgi:hypothetical protein
MLGEIWPLIAVMIGVLILLPSTPVSIDVIMSAINVFNLNHMISINKISTPIIT